jgi:hypothetical protein
VARWFRLGLSVSGPFGCRCLICVTLLRFHTPLIEPDGRISRIRLSDKVSWIPLVHTFAHEPLWLLSLKLVQSQPLVQVLVREPFLSLSPHLEPDVMMRPFWRDDHPVARPLSRFPSISDRLDAEGALSVLVDNRLSPV